MAMSPQFSEVAHRAAGANEKTSEVEFQVWAPQTEAVDLILWDSQGPILELPMQSRRAGNFQLSAERVSEGQRYKFRLADGGEWPDPASRWQPEGVHGPSALLFPERFVWTDAEWAGVFRRDLVLYELHVGTFTPEGTFEAVIPRLPELRELGVTAIELMPIAQFPGSRGWGYDGVFPYAAQNTYGGPHGLQKLVDALAADSKLGSNVARGGSARQAAPERSAGSTFW